MSTSDPMAAARQQGVRDLRDVDLATLDSDDKISFFTATHDAEGARAAAGAQ
jgi:uncharacterized membrane protein YcaP (DUF421 family)